MKTHKKLDKRIRMYINHNNNWKHKQKKKKKHGVPLDPDLRTHILR